MPQDLTGVSPNMEGTIQMALMPGTIDHRQGEFREALAPVSTAQRKSQNGLQENDTEQTAASE